MRELLTPALAEANPRAYAAHFKRLDDARKRAYLAGLSAQALRTHFATLGEAPTIGLILRVDGPMLEATVGGGPLGEAVGPACGALQARALALGRQLDARVVSGLVSGATLARLPLLEAALRAVEWTPRAIVLAGDGGGDDCAPSLGWSLRGALPKGGTFYLPSEPLSWDERGAAQVRLEALAARVGAVLDVRLA